MEQNSLRRLLFRWMLLPLVAVLTGAAVIAYPVALRPATEAYDWVLVDTAQSLVRLINSRSDDTPEAILEAVDILLRTDQFDRIYYSVHDAQDRLIAGDAHLGPPPDLFHERELLYDRRINLESVRVAALRVELRGAEAVVQVAETRVKRNQLTTRILSGMIASEAVLVIAVIALVLFGIGKGLEPLERLRAEIGARSLRDLRPVPSDHAPAEVKPLVLALNELLVRLNLNLQSQQKFIADAAHQLRTPLAGLLMQVEYGLSQNDPVERKRVLDTLKLSIERAIRLANQLLALARAEAGFSRAETMRTVDLREVVEDVAGKWMPQAIQKKIDLGFDLGSAPVRGDMLLLGELLSNLLDNAISHTPACGRITVSTAMQDGWSVLTVDDDGVGIPEAEHEQVFERFYRVDDSTGDGCGLGLAIVQEIAHLHGASAAVETPPGRQGTVMRVRLPSAS
ncbi:MAG: sensor histidine kinase [Burkholderiales bacterium]|jgi:two-component system sensor histidine kinase TctE|nr:sensor histidine kinase [Burkholderiales bacterium]